MMMMMMMKGFCSFLFVRFSFNATNNLFLSCSAAFFFSRSIQCYSNDFISIWRRPSPARMPTNLFFVSRQLPHPLSLSHSRLYPSLFFFFFDFPFFFGHFYESLGAFNWLPGNLKMSGKFLPPPLLGQISIVDWKAAPPFLYMYIYPLVSLYRSVCFGDDGE